MKVLLLGEFSSLHRYLKEGLLELGDIEVRLFANGDSWKKIGGADGALFPEDASGLRRRYDYYIEPFHIAKQFTDYDVVQFVNTNVYPSLIAKDMIKKIASRNKCVSLVAAGSDYALAQAYQNGLFDYYMYDYDNSIVQGYNGQKLRGKIHIAADREIVNRSDIIIPSLYEYTVGYQDQENLYSVIPFPVNLAGIDYQDNQLGEKVVFFHGLNREAAKGTPFIRAALERLQAEYPNDVEVVIDGKMPFDKYVDVMRRANVVIDQCCSYGYGINACIAMAQGKVVMSGSRPETLHAFGIDASPIVPICPDTEQIYTQLKYMVENREHIQHIGYESRKYVENLHDHIRVAQKYVNAWKSTGKV